MTSLAMTTAYDSPIAPTTDEPAGIPSQRPTFRQTLPVLLLMLGATLALFIASSLRHYMFRSGALDLAFFDQLAYLISKGETPISSILGFHLLADHAAYSLYIVAPFYWIWDNVHMLLLVQAMALASGAYPIWRLARMRGVDQWTALALSGVYLLYPIVLTANLFDFHPEVLSVPALLFAVLAERQGRYGYFILSLVIALGGKEIIGLTVAMFGIWLIFFEKRRSFGVIALVMGAGWFVFATRWLIPQFGGGKEASGVGFFAHLGSSVPEIGKNLFLHPSWWAKVVFSKGTIKYLCILFLPVIWGLVPRRMSPLIVALPTLALNILASHPQADLKNPFGQYSLMVVPFLALAIVEAVAHREAWLLKPRWIFAWSFGLVLAGAGARLLVMKTQQTSNYQNQRDTREALKLIKDDRALLTTHEIAPHVSHRKVIQYLDPARNILPLDQFHWVLINLGQDSAKNASALVQATLDRMRSDPGFQEKFRQGDVVLFERDR